MDEEFYASIGHRELRAFYECWLTLGPQFLRTDFSPERFVRFLPNLFLMDVLPNRQFRYRLVGTAIDAHVGKSVTGMLMHEFRVGKTLEELTELFCAASEQRRVSYYRSQIDTETHPFVTYHRLAAPLFDRSGGVPVVLGCWYYDFFGIERGTVLKISQQDYAYSTVTRRHSAPIPQ